MEVEYLRVGYVPCSSLIRITEWLKDYKSIINLNASRGFNSKSVSENVKDVPFIRFREGSIKSLVIDYTCNGKHGFKTFPLDKTIKTIKNTNMDDVSLNKIEILCNSEEFYNKWLKDDSITKSDNPEFTLSFIAKITKDKNIRNDISRYVAYQIDKLHFKYETLDLVGIFSISDRKTGEHYNLLPAINQNTEMLKEALNIIFNNAPLRIRNYTSKGRKSWELVSSENI